jgi:hypothetical protein
MATPSGREDVGACCIAAFTVERRVKRIKLWKTRHKWATLRIVNDSL